MHMSSLLFIKSLVLASYIFLLANDFNINFFLPRLNINSTYCLKRLHQHTCDVNHEQAIRRVSTVDAIYSIKAIG